MPRYATILTGDDGAEIVSAIGEFENAHPPLRAGRVEEVAPGVLIGMVRGGPLEAVAGFGFPRRGLGPSAIGAAVAKLKALAAPPKPARAKPRRKPARKVRKARAKATPPAAVAHG